MEKEEIVKIINELGAENPLTNHIDYKETLINSLLPITEMDNNKLKTLLCGNERYSKFKYNQGIAEIMLYILFSKNKLSFKSEIKQNEVNNCNVDLVVEYNGVSYNFEVKSPKYEEHVEGTLSGEIADRSGEKKYMDEVMANLMKEIEPHLSKGGYSSVKPKMPNDNKVKDCLLSAQTKFSDPTKENCNFLFICSTSQVIMKYWWYIVNKRVGFFGPNSNVSSFLDTNGNHLTKNKYNKVNAIVLSNAISLNERHNTDSWDLNKSINLVLINPFAKYKDEKSIASLFDFFPHKTKEFDKLFDKMKNNSPDIPELAHIPTIFSNLGFNMNQE